MRGSTEWQKTSNERYAEKWFEAHGFSCKLIRQYLSKTVYEVSRDGKTLRFDLPSSVTRIKAFMEQFEKSWQLMLENMELERRLNEMNSTSTADKDGDA